jgi:histidinol dehydrogenase
VLKKLDLRGHGTEVNGLLPRPNISGDEPNAVVADIIASVRRDGDSAVVGYTAKFDGVNNPQYRVEADDIQNALQRISPELRAALEVAVENVDVFHRHQLRSEAVVERNGMVIRAFQKPVRRAGLYVPGGRAVYPSTVVMTAVPARVAGVGEIALCVPPDQTTGTVSPAVLAAAALSGVDEVYAVGGAQAIAAMAYGTQLMKPVDVIAGPGNVYVALAKQQVAGDVGIAAAFAGPSEVVVVADATANPLFAAIDVIVQAEHGPDGLAWLVTWDEDVADAVCAAGDEYLKTSPRAADVRSTLAEGGFAALVDDPAAAIAVIDAIAPEHLELQVEHAVDFGRNVTNAGAIFCGNLAPASVGDYVAGPSHVLPTFGSARFSSALTVSDFVRDHHIVTIDQETINDLGPHVVALAEAEGLAAHAESVRVRLS